MAVINVRVSQVKMPPEIAQKNDRTDMLRHKLHKDKKNKGESSLAVKPPSKKDENQDEKTQHPKKEEKKGQNPILISKATQTVSSSLLFSFLGNKNSHE